jgi:PEP-CTERM motif
MLFSRFLVLLGLAAAFQAPASAALTAVTLFNNTGFTTLPSSLGFGGWAVDGSALSFNHQTSSPVAAEFTPTVSASLTQIDVYLEGGGAPDENGVTFSIYSNLNGVPGSQIGGSWMVTAPSSNSDLFTIAATGVNFVANTSYWLVANPAGINSDADWTTNKTYIGPYAFGSTTSGSTSWNLQSGLASDPYFEIVGETPEPGTLWLAALGLAFMIRCAISSGLPPKTVSPRRGLSKSAAC